jgi:hypothetical protein
MTIERKINYQGGKPDKYLSVVFSGKYIKFNIFLVATERL